MLLRVQPMGSGTQAAAAAEDVEQQRGVYLRVQIEDVRVLYMAC